MEQLTRELIEASFKRDVVRHVVAAVSVPQSSVVA